MSILLNEPTDKKGNCAGCGKPIAGWRYRYNLCLQCLTPGRFKREQDAEAVRRSKSYKSKTKHR